MFLSKITKSKTHFAFLVLLPLKLTYVGLEKGSLRSIRLLKP